MHRKVSPPIGEECRIASRRLVFHTHPMAATQLIAARVTPETKAHVRALAQRQELTESAFLKRLIDLTQPTVTAASVAAADQSQRLARAARLTIRLRPEDRLLLRERATARGMPAATYVSLLVRAHLRHLTPLPKGELLALKRVVAELGAIGRNLNQIARAANENDRHAGPDRDALRAMLKVSEGLRDHVKALIKANAHSWETGHAEARA